MHRNRNIWIIWVWQIHQWSCWTWATKLVSICHSQVFIFSGFWPPKIETVLSWMQIYWIVLVKCKFTICRCIYDIRECMKTISNTARWIWLYFHPTKRCSFIKVSECEVENPDIYCLNRDRSKESQICSKRMLVPSR